MSYFLFIPLRPFFYAALAKRWKVQFRKGLRKFNNVDSKTTYFNENCCIIYIYVYTQTYKQKGDRAECGNSRGIYLLSKAGKVLAKIMLTHLLEHVVDLVLS